MGVNATPESPATAAEQTRLLVCVSCRRRDESLPQGYDEPGKLLLVRLEAELAGSAVRVEPVACLSVCKRPCTVALQAPGKWTYVIGDLDGGSQIEGVTQDLAQDSAQNLAKEVARGALLYAESHDGIVPWRERPQSFRKGVVARVPPLNLELPA